jgi:hypothetical protein
MPKQPSKKKLSKSHSNEDPLCDARKTVIDAARVGVQEWNDPAYRYWDNSKATDTQVGQQELTKQMWALFNGTVEEKEETRLK